MGWNDRLLEDPYVPPSSYYEDRAAYEAWREYIEQQDEDAQRSGISSQNIAPPDLPAPKLGLFRRTWARIVGATKQQHQNQ